MPKFHVINDGVIKPCKATVKPCPYSGELHIEAKSLSDANNIYFKNAPLFENKISKNGKILISAIKESFEDYAYPGYVSIDEETGEATVVLDLDDEYFFDLIMDKTDLDIVENDIKRYMAFSNESVGVTTVKTGLLINGKKYELNDKDFSSETSKEARIIVDNHFLETVEVFSDDMENFHKLDVSDSDIVLVK